jgi:hypothetical protein
MNASAPLNLHPMNLAELLDRAIRLYRQNFLTFTGIIAIPLIPLMLINAVLSVFTSASMVDQMSMTPDPANPFAMFNPAVIAASMGSLLIQILQFILVQGVAAAALTHAVAGHYMGTRIGILDSYRGLQNSWLNLILALILIGVLSFLLVFWSIVPLVGWFTGPGILIFLALIVGPLVAPVIILERGGIVQAIRRAWDLARSRFWWLVGYGVVIALFRQLIVTGPIFLLSFLIQFLSTLLPPNLDLQVIINSILQNLVAIVTLLLYLPLQLTIMTVIYFDLRTRNEGLDLAIQLRGESAENTDVNLLLPEISPQSGMPFFTGIDLGRFALISLAMVAFYFSIVGFLFMLISFSI